MKAADFFASERIDAFFSSSIAVWAVAALAAIAFSINHEWAEFWWTDEARHAMDGVFFLDFFKDLPLSDPIGYAEEYFARFPALGFTWYLPFFAITESLFYGILGISLATTKIHVAAWFILMAISAFFWSRRLTGSPAVAFFGVVFLITNAEVLLWGRSVMLEVPAVAMMILTLLSVDRYLKTPTFGWSTFLGLVIFCMLMTKQTTLFILGVAFMQAVLYGKWRLLFIPSVLPALLLSLAGAVSIALHAMIFGKSGFEVVSNSASALNVWLLTKMPSMVEQLLQVFGVGIWLATALGTFFLFRVGHSKSAILLWLWIVLGLLFLSFLVGDPSNQKRYSVYFAPPVYFLAGSVILLPLQSRVLKGLSVAFLLVAAAPGIAAGLTLRHPVVNGYAEVADFVSSLETKAPAMFCCKHDGNFVFYMRQNDPARKSVTLRADKVLISTVVHLHRGVVAHTEDADDILESLQANGVGYLVLEDRTLEQVSQFGHLRKLAETARFERLRDFRIDSSEAAYDGIAVSVFRNKTPSARAGTTVTIPFPHLGRSIQLDLGQ